MKSNWTRTALLIAAAFLAAFLATGCTSSHTTDLKADYPEAKTQIQQRLQEVFVAAQDKDFNKLDSYHLYGPKFTKFSSSASERLV